MMYRVPVCVAATSLYFNKKKPSKESYRLVYIFLSWLFKWRKKRSFILKNIYQCNKSCKTLRRTFHLIVQEKDDMIGFMVSLVSERY